MGGVVERVDIDALSEDSRTSGIILEKSCNVFVDVLTDRQTDKMFCLWQTRTHTRYTPPSLNHSLLVSTFVC